MNKFFTLFLCAAMFCLASCGQTEQVKVNTNSVAMENKAKNENASTDMPKTEKADGKYVESETGTEKAKPEPGKANVQGKVLFNEKPAEGVEVRICEKFNRFMGGCNGESFKTKTDADGEYLFANIKPGVYQALAVKVFDSNSYIFATKSLGILAAEYNFDADKTFFAPATNLFKDDLKIQNPKPNAKIDASALELKWDVYPDAAYYKVNLLPAESDYDSMISNEKVEGTTYKPTKTLKNGKYRLRLEAYNANNVKLAELSKDIEFSLTGGTGTSKDASSSSSDNERFDEILENAFDKFFQTVVS